MLSWAEDPHTSHNLFPSKINYTLKPRMIPILQTRPFTNLLYYIPPDRHIIERSPLRASVRTVMRADVWEECVPTLENKLKEKT